MNELLLSHERLIQKVKRLTNESPDFVLEHGDPNGRLLLLMFDVEGQISTSLNVIDKETFYNLVEKGRVDTISAYRKLLNPQYKHKDYNPLRFADSLKL